MIGEGITLDRTKDMRSGQDLADIFERHAPGTILVDMADAGLLPMHPEVNFMPVADQRPGVKPPKGVFAEVVIIDPERLLNTINRKPKQERMKLINRYLRYLYWREFDFTYETLLQQIIDKRGDKTLLQNAEVTSAMFQLTESIRRKHKTPNRQLDHEKIFDAIVKQLPTGKTIQDATVTELVSAVKQAANL